MFFPGAGTMRCNLPRAARYSQFTHINLKAALDEYKVFDILSIRLTNGSLCQGSQASFGTLRPAGSEVGYELRIASSRASREPVPTCADGLARRSTPGFLLFRSVERTSRQERGGSAGPDTKIFDN